MLEKLRKLREHHLKTFHDVDFYPYQEKISDAILNALIQNLRITANATEEDIKKLRLTEQPVEISRQAGKTTDVVLTVEFIMIYLTKLFNRRINIGIFAPQAEQAKTDFDRLKEALSRSKIMFNVQTEEAKEYQEQSNAKTLVLPNGSSCYIFPVTKTSKPESKSLDLIIFEESQDLEDRIVKEQIWPMGASTNAPRIYIGTAGTRICYFRNIGMGANAIKLYFEEIVKQRRVVYEKTGDARHLIYEQSVRQEIERHGLEADEVQRPYFGKWLIGSGQFTTQEELERITDNSRRITHHFKKGECFAGIDVAKHPDSTVVTILRYNEETGKKELLNWMELHGENYQHQYEVMIEFLNHYNVVALAIDSTGVGDPVTDMFVTHSEWQDEHSGLYALKFSAVSKDNIYRNLKLSIKQSLTTLPNLSTKIGEKFKQQMLDLQQEYKGQLLSVKHPDDPNAHDDFPDSWALAEWAYAKYYGDGGVGVAVVTVGAKERKVEKNENNETTDYWPGLDFTDGE